METVVQLPELLQLGWCERGLGDEPWFPSDPEPVRVVAETPVALAVLGAWAAYWRARDRPIVVDDRSKGPYAWRSGLLSALAGRFGRTVASNERRIQAHLATEEEIEPTLDRCRRVLHLDDVSSSLGDAALYFLSELLRNVFEHAGSPLGAFVSGGHFPQTGRTSFAVVDLGVTVPHHIQRRWKQKVAAADALALALEPRATGSTDLRRNAGMGLYMTRRIVSLLGGFFWMLTADCLIRDDAPARMGRRPPLAVEAAPAPWQGTCVAWTLFPRNLPSFEAELRHAQRELELPGPRGGRGPDLFRRKPEDGTLLVRIGPDVSTIAQDKRRAQRIRDEQILPALARSERLSLDFRGVTLTTQSYVHALIAEPVRTLGHSELDARLCFVGAGHQVKQVIRIVVNYALDDSD